MTFNPMLAQNFKAMPAPYVYAQPKLDGIRLIARREGLFTRSGGHITCLHEIEADLESLFSDHPEVTLDGELYSDSLSLPEIISASRGGIAIGSAERTPNPLKFHVFDMPQGDAPFRLRHDRLSQLFETLLRDRPHVAVVPTRLITCEEDLNQHYDACLIAGFEGQMVRLDAPYVHGRSSNLLKRKPNSTQEFPVKQIHKVRGDGDYPQSFTLELPDGRSFDAGITGCRTLTRELLHRPPTTATVRFSGRTPGGIPRSASVVAWYHGPRLV